MRRADRLFQIVEFLRGRRLTTAAFLAGRLGVSLRTVYRDVRDLSLSGVPVEGEAGVGYRPPPGFAVPPPTFPPNKVRAPPARRPLGGARARPAAPPHARPPPQQNS